MSNTPVSPCRLSLKTLSTKYKLYDGPDALIANKLLELGELKLYSDYFRRHKQNNVDEPDELVDEPTFTLI